MGCIFPLIMLAALIAMRKNGKKRNKYCGCAKCNITAGKLYKAVFITLFANIIEETIQFYYEKLKDTYKNPAERLNTSPNLQMDPPFSYSGMRITAAAYTVKKPKQIF